MPLTAFNSKSAVSFHVPPPPKLMDHVLRNGRDLRAAAETFDKANADHWQIVERKLREQLDTIIASLPKSNPG